MLIIVADDGDVVGVRACLTVLIPWIIVCLLPTVTASELGRKCSAIETEMAT